MFILFYLQLDIDYIYIILFNFSCLIYFNSNYINYNYFIYFVSSVMYLF